MIVVLNVKSSEHDIIEGIINNDSRIISLIYKNDYERIKSMVTGFGNIGVTPEDIFQEGLTRAVINIRKGNFKGGSTFSTYLYGICRNLCLKAYNRQAPVSGMEIQDVKEEIQDDYFDELELIVKLKEMLDEQCIKIIDLRFGITPTKDRSTRFEAIAGFLGISADNARQRFRRCFSKLKSIVHNNKEFKQIIS